MMQEARDALSRVLDNRTLAEMRALGKTNKDQATQDAQTPPAGEAMSAASAASAPHAVNRG